MQTAQVHPISGTPVEVQLPSILIFISDNPIIEGQFVGLGAKGYEMAFRYLVETDQEKDAQQGR